MQVALDTLALNAFNHVYASSFKVNWNGLFGGYLGHSVLEVLQIKQILMLAGEYMLFNCIDGAMMRVRRGKVSLPDKHWPPLGQILDGLAIIFNL